MKRVVSIVLSVVLLVGCCLPGAIVDAADAVYTGKAMMVVNTVLDSKYPYEGSFNLTDASAASLASEEIFDTYTDPVSGMEMQISSYQPEPMVLVDIEEDYAPIMLQEEASYSVGSTTVLHTFNRVLKTDNTYQSVPVDTDMQCLYIGEYCTVWGATSDNEEITLQKSHGRKLGKSFDENYAAFAEIFGGTWHDTDGDGKIALMCYDMDQERASGITDFNQKSYRAGYFYSRDMIDKTGHIGGYYSGEENYLNGMDLLHIDTYPGMGTEGNLLGDLERCESTLFHELQHMVNFSNDVSVTARQSMETFMDEAFSMAAEHLVLGTDAVLSRITYFNGVNYSAGYPLTYWNESLSNYSNSYLFGQYLRTQYGLRNNSSGNELFKVIYEARKKTPEASSLSIAANLLGLTGEDAELQLVKNFWSAVYLKEDSGPYGFAGEAWADRIQPKLSELDTEYGNRLIYNGGVKYYLLPEGGYTVNSSEYVDFVTFDQLDPASQAAPGIVQAYTERSDHASCKITVQLDKTGTVYITVGKEKAVKGSGRWHSTTLEPSTVYTLRWGGLQEGMEYWASYYTINDSTGEESDIRYLLVSACPVYDMPYEECGDDLTWELDENGVLTICGSGPMVAFNSEKNQPWADRREDIKQILLGPGVTAIGDYAFAGCDAVELVRIPMTVTCVGKAAFKDCDGLTKAVFAGTENTWNTIVKVNEENDSLKAVLVFAKKTDAILRDNLSLIVESKKEMNLMLESKEAGYAIVTTFDQNGRMIECCMVEVKEGFNHATVAMEQSDLFTCDISLFRTGSTYLPTDYALSLDR